MGDPPLQDASWILEQLLDPPAIPDAAWYSAAATALVRAGKHRAAGVLSAGGGEGPACGLLLRVLHEGQFRSQSAALEFIATVVSEEPGRETPRGDAATAGGGALALMADDPDMPVLTAAVNLCGEQKRTLPPVPNGAAADAVLIGAWPRDSLGGERRDAAEKQSSAPGDAQASRSTGEAREWMDASDDGDEDGDEFDDAPLDEQDPGEEGVDAAGNGGCCDDPFDCEEPAVREAALHLLSCLAARVALPGASSAREGGGGAGEEREGEGGGGGEAARAARLVELCGAAHVVRAVLQGMRASSASVSDASSRALAAVLVLPLPAGSLRQVQRFMARHLRGTGAFLADAALSLPRPTTVRPPVDSPASTAEAALTTPHHAPPERGGRAAKRCRDDDGGWTTRGNGGALLARYSQAGPCACLSQPGRGRCPCRMASGTLHDLNQMPTTCRC